MIRRKDGDPHPPALDLASDMEKRFASMSRSSEQAFAESNIVGEQAFADKIKVFC